VRPHRSVCRLTILLSSMALAQSNPVPLINQSAGVVAPTSASQLPSERFRAAARQRTPEQAQGPLFAPAVGYGSGGSQAYSVAIGDVNGDGKPDLVVANEFCSINCENGSVSVLLGNGDGTFQAAVSYSSGGYAAVSVAVRDVNGDGKPDLVVANKFCNINCENGSVSVLLGNGDGTFQPAVSYGSGGYQAYSVAVADVNGDGRPDLVVANEFCNLNCANGSVSVLLGNGDGTFQAAVSYSSGGYAAVSVAMGDVNGDGRPDLVVANECVSNLNCANGLVSVLLGNGDGTFEPAVSYDSGGSLAYSVAMGDVNGDGRPDLVVVNEFCNLNCANGLVSVLLGNGDGTFEPAASYDSGGYQAVSVALGDVNGDGNPDLVVANEFCTLNCENGSVSVLLGNGDGTFQAAVSYSSGGYAAYSVAMGDVNGDGKPDLAVTNDSSNGLVSVLLHIKPTTSTLISSSNPSNFGQSVAFTATVTSQGSGTPTGTVTFSDGSTSLGTSPLSGGTAIFSTAALTVGLHSINAAYSGDSNFSGSSASLNQTVNQAGTTTSLTSAPNPSAVAQAVTLTAVVAPAYTGTPTGTVTFMDGATTLGTGTLNGGVATYTTSSLAIGQHSMTAVYSGDANNGGSTSSVLTQTVNADFAFTSSPSGATITAGQLATFTLTVTPQGSFTSPISFSCSGLPPLAGCIFKPPSVTPNSSTVTSTLTITTTAQLASLVSPFGRRSSPLYAMWLVLPAVLMGTAGTAASKRRKLLSYCLAFLLVGGCLLQAACGSGGRGTPAGTYTITVTGAASSTQHTTTVTLTVR
jgi:hypothetical protein